MFSLTKQTSRQREILEVLKNQSKVIITIAAIVRIDRSDKFIKEARVQLDPSLLLETK